jgi:hypothetical protein
MELRAEELSFNLTLAGRPAGSQRLSTSFERGLFVMRLEASFQGSMGSQKRAQISRLEPQSRLPASFMENDNGRVFETIFDRRDGLVRVRQNRDEASAALTQDYQDPVSMLQFLRDLPDETRSARVPMIGGTVLVTRLEDETIDTAWGPLLSRVYYLRPGVSLVYIEAAAPHRILKLTQSLGKLALEASLTRVSEGSTLRDSDRSGERSVAGDRAAAERPPRGQQPRARRGASERSGSERGMPERTMHERKASEPQRPVEPRQESEPGRREGSRSRRRGRGRNKGERGAEQGTVNAAVQQPRAQQQHVNQTTSTPRANPLGAETTEGTAGSGAGRAKRRRRSRRRNAKTDGSSGE